MLGLKKNHTEHWFPALKLPASTKNLLWLTR